MASITATSHLSAIAMIGAMKVFFGNNPITSLLSKRVGDNGLNLQVAAWCNDGIVAMFEICIEKHIPLI